jgi:anti-sigma factor RsiW
MSDPVDLMCKEVVELVTDFLSNALSLDDRARFEEHLADCPPCTSYVAQVKRTIELSRELSGDLGGELSGKLREGPAQEVPPELLDVFRRWKAR